MIGSKNLQFFKKVDQKNILFLDEISNLLIYRKN